MQRPTKLNDLTRLLDQPLGDPQEPTLWQGRRLTWPGAATGGRLPTQRYRLTAKALSWTTSRIPGRQLSAPTWAIRDAQVSQSVAQRARRLGDVTVSFQHPDYTGSATFVVLENIESPKQAARALSTASREARRLRGGR